MTNEILIFNTHISNLMIKKQAKSLATTFDHIQYLKILNLQKNFKLKVNYVVTFYYCDLKKVCSI